MLYLSYQDVIEESYINGDLPFEAIIKINNIIDEEQKIKVRSGKR